MGHSLLKLSEIGSDVHEQSAYVRGFADGKADKMSCHDDYSFMSRCWWAYMAGYDAGCETRGARLISEAISYSSPPFLPVANDNGRAA